MTKHNYSWARVVHALGSPLEGLALALTGPNNVLFYRHPDASNYLRRFYRAFQFP